MVQINRSSNSSNSPSSIEVGFNYRSNKSNYFDDNDDFEDKADSPNTVNSGISRFFSMAILLSLIFVCGLTYKLNMILKQNLNDIHKINEDIHQLRRELNINESDLKATKTNILSIRDVLKSTLKDVRHEDQDLSTVLETITNRNNAKLQQQFSLQDGIREIDRRNLEQR